MFFQLLNMPIKNSTTIMPANCSISEIQDALVQYGATGMLYKYEQGTGRMEALQFLWRIKNQDVAFSLPVRWRRFQASFRTAADEAVG